MGNVSANENNKFYSPVVELYEKAESRVVQFFNNLTDKSTTEGLNLNFKIKIKLYTKIMNIL